MGFVIGKNGETIKRIQAETGAKVQFNMSKLNSTLPMSDLCACILQEWK